jgi:hypothetical protein
MGGKTIRFKRGVADATMSPDRFCGAVKGRPHGFLAQRDGGEFA